MVAIARLYLQDIGVGERNRILILSLDLDVSFIWDRTEEPQVAEDGTTPEKDDFRFIVSLGYEF